MTAKPLGRKRKHKGKDQGKNNLPTYDELINPNSKTQRKVVLTKITVNK